MSPLSNISANQFSTEPTAQMEQTTADSKPILVTGVGSWPGVDISSAISETLGTLPHIGYLPELPQRGIYAQLVGRGAGVLVDFPVEHGVGGWRTAASTGRDLRRVRAIWQEDLDQLFEQGQGYSGQIKLSVCGPWTLASEIHHPRLGKLFSDSYAFSDLLDSYIAGISQLLDHIHRGLPETELIVQLDEPLVDQIVSGRIANESGLSHYPAIQAEIVAAGLAKVLKSVSSSCNETVLHSCARTFPFEVATLSGFSVISLDLDQGLKTRQFKDAIFSWADQNRKVFLGVHPTHNPNQLLTVDEIVAKVLDLIEESTLQFDQGQLVLTPACGLPTWGRKSGLEVLHRLLKAATLIAERIFD